MPDWHLTRDDPRLLRLAADVRLGPSDPSDDHIWELSLGEGEPPALAARTTYGLRARDLRLFPVFREAGRLVHSPAEFAAAPAVRAFHPNYLRVTFEPLEDLAVTAHYWAPNSHTLAGQFELVSRAPGGPRPLRLSLAGVLKPLDRPQPLGAAQHEGRAMLEGQSGNLHILAALDGPAEADSVPFAELSRLVRLSPGEPVVVRWATAARPRSADGLALLRAVFAREWEGEFARLDLLNAGRLEIETGDRDWDAALALAQTAAVRGCVGPAAHLPHPALVGQRGPDRGYSRRGEGSEPLWHWDAASALQAYALLPQIAPAAPELALGVVRNWLAGQNEAGFIEWKPGLGGPRHRILCQPLLASLAWRLYEHTEDRAFLEAVLPGLRRFNDVWFSPRHDHDGDGVPEWSHTLQSGFDANPSFARAFAWAQGADLALVESPDLAAYLYRECQSLRQIGQALGQADDPALEARAARLAAALAEMWRAETGSCHYRDRDAHTVTAGQVLAEGRGPLSVDVQRRFSPAARLLVRAHGPGEARADMSVTLIGRGPRGRQRVETLKGAHISWMFGRGTAVSAKLYAELERVEVAGLSDDFEVQAAVVDTSRQDLSLLLPLWSGALEAERAGQLADSLLDPARYWRRHGLPRCSAQDPAYRADGRDGCGGVDLAWNTMLGEGLLQAGRRAEAAELVGRLMSAVVHSLRAEQGFREAYNADQLEGLGERDCLWGAAPVALFMKTIGLRLISPRRVHVEGRNPFPGPVTVRWKGLAVTRAGDRTTVVFPSGRTVQVDGEAPRFVEDAQAA